MTYLLVANLQQGYGIVPRGVSRFSDVVTWRSGALPHRRGDMGGERRLEAERLGQIAEESLFGLARGVSAIDGRRIDLRGELLRAASAGGELGGGGRVREL